MAQPSPYNFTEGDLDLSHKRNDFKINKGEFNKVFSKLAWEILEFYCEDFKTENYPHFGEIKSSLKNEDNDFEDKQKIVKIAQELFK